MCEANWLFEGSFEHSLKEEIKAFSMYTLLEV